MPPIHKMFDFKEIINSFTIFSIFRAMLVSYDLSTTASESSLSCGSLSAICCSRSSLVNSVLWESRNYKKSAFTKSWNLSPGTPLANLRMFLMSTCCLGNQQVSNCFWPKFLPGAICSSKLQPIPGPLYIYHVVKIGVRFLEFTDIKKSPSDLQPRYCRRCSTCNNCRMWLNIRIIHIKNTVAS